MRLQGVFFTPEECDTLWNLQQGNRWYVSTEFGTYFIVPDDPDENWKQAPEYLNYLKQKESGIPLPLAAGRLRSECQIDLLKIVDDENSKCFSDIILSKVDWFKPDFHLGGGSKLLKMLPGDFLNKHVDQGPEYLPELHRRQYTFIIQLSNPDEYEGGDFLIGDYRLPKDKGFCCLFDGGTQVHEVTKVTKGERKSWITWMPKESLTIF